MTRMAPDEDNHNSGHQLSASIFSFFKQLFPYFKLYPALTLILITVLILDISCITSFPLITKVIFDDAIANKNFHLLLVLLAILFGLLTILVFSWIAENILSTKLGVSITDTLRLSLFEKIQNLSRQQLSQGRASDVLLRYGNDLTIVSFTLIQIMWGTISYVVYCVATIGILFYLNWKMAFFVVITMPFLFLSAWILDSRSRSHFGAKKMREARLFSMVREGIEHNFSVKILRLAKVNFAEFKKQLTLTTQKDYFYNVFMMMVKSAITAGSIFLRLGIIALGSYMVFAGHLSIGGFIAFFSLYLGFSGSIIEISGFYPPLAQAAQGMNRITELVNLPVESKQKEKLPDLPRFSKSISFEHVDFDYPLRKGALKDVHIEILKGEETAIVGPSGSGKSTLLDLLLHQEIPTRGKILFDGKDIQQYSSNSLFAQVGVVLRNPALFNMSIADNIRMGKWDATREEIIDAAKAAEIHVEILTFQNGYDSLIGEGGLGLSSGQTQRIMLARALVSNPAILILDEATSALDIANETAVMQTLQKQAKQRTTIMVTHNLKETIHMDKIIVLQQGCVAEIGNHKELLAKKGKYYNLWIKQTGVTITEDGARACIKPSWLRRIPLFEMLSDALLKKLTDDFIIVEIAANQVVFEEKTQGDQFYIIVKGLVEISKSTETNEREVLAILENGDFFGEIALLHSILRTARVTTREACTLLVLYRTQFTAFFDKLPAPTREKIQAIAKERSTHH